jgi:hypothetical protein
VEITTTGTHTKTKNLVCAIEFHPLITTKIAQDALATKRKSVTLSSHHQTQKIGTKYFRSKAHPKTKIQTIKTNPECMSLVIITFLKKNKTAAKVRRHIYSITTES